MTGTTYSLSGITTGATYEYMSYVELMKYMDFSGATTQQLTNIMLEEFKLDQLMKQEKLRNNILIKQVRDELKYIEKDDVIIPELIKEGYKADNSLSDYEKLFNISKIYGSSYLNKALLEYNLSISNGLGIYNFIKWYKMLKSGGIINITAKTK